MEARETIASVNLSRPDLASVSAAVVQAEVDAGRPVPSPEWVIEVLDEAAADHAADVAVEVSE